MWGFQSGRISSTKPADGQNVFLMYARTSLWQDSIPWRQVKISTCPSLGKNLPRRSGISHFRTERENLTPLSTGIHYDERWVKTCPEYCGCPSVSAKYWLRKA